jgi:hypothetical protein
MEQNYYLEAKIGMLKTEPGKKLMEKQIGTIKG